MARSPMGQDDFVPVVDLSHMGPASASDRRTEARQVTHEWTEYLAGGAHCPKCGTVRMPTGEIRRGWLAPCEPLVPSPTARVVVVVVDGWEVTVDGPPS